MNANPQTLLIVGAGAEQVPIIETAMGRGLRVIAVDGNPHAPGFDLATLSKVVSTRDEQGVLAVAKENNVDGITYMITETPLAAIRHAACALNLPAPTANSVEASVSKARMREIFEACGVRNPKFDRTTRPERASDIAQDIGYPLVIKPADSSGQAGLTRVDDPAQLSAAFACAVEASPTAEVILEECLDGPELNAVGIVLGGEVRALTISDREKHPTKAFGVVMRHVFPAHLDAPRHQAVVDLCFQVVQALGIENGVIFPQIINTATGPVMVEIGERVPGGIMKELFEFATGFDLLNLQIDIALGDIAPLETYRTVAQYDAVVVKFLTCDPGPLKPGRVADVTGWDDMMKRDGVLAADYFYKGGPFQEIKSLKASPDRFFYIVAGGASRDEACARADDAARTLDFMDEHGNTLVDWTNG